MSKDQLSAVRYAALVWSLPHDRREIRERVGFTIADVAEIVGAPGPLVRLWEGGAQPDGRYVERYAAVLHACRSIAETKAMWVRLGLRQSA